MRNLEYNVEIKVRCCGFPCAQAIKYTFPAALFMLATTIGALIYQIIHFIPQKKYLLITVSIALLILAFFVILEAIKVFRQKERGR